MNTILRPGHYLGVRAREWTGAGFAVALRRATVPADEVLEHSHEGAHLVLAIDESYLTRAAGAAPRSGAMTLVYNPPGTLHRDCFAVTGGRFLSIDIPDSFAPPGMADPTVARDPDARAAAGRAAGRISSGDCDDLEIEDLLLAMLAGIGAARPAVPVPDWLSRAAEALADLAPERSVTVREIARAVNVHPVHLARVYRRHFGCGPGEAMGRHRVARAAGRLSRGAALAEVALDAGFADQSHMTRAFRRAYGTTPARFRDAFG